MYNLRLGKLQLLPLVLLLTLALLSGCGGAAKDTEESGALPVADRVAVYDGWSEDAEEMLRLSSGAWLSNTAFTFAYDVSSSFSSVEVYYDLYEGGELKNSAQNIFLYRFASDAAEGRRSGKLLIDMNNGFASIDDTYHKTAPWAWPESTNVQVIHKYMRGELPESDVAPFRASFRSNFGARVAAEDSESNAEPGTPVMLMFFGESESEDAIKACSQKTAEEILADSELLAAYDRAYFFYCIVR